MRPRLMLTLGDPAGVGPETIVRVWNDSSLHEQADLVAVGPYEIACRAAKRFAPEVNVVRAAVEDAAPIWTSTPHRLVCVDVGRADAASIPPGQIDARGGQAAYDALIYAARQAMAGAIDGLVTAPLHKEALHAAGHNYPGHTELLAELCGVRDVAMMLYLPPGEAVRGPVGLGVAHVTLHCAMRDVFDQLTPERILSRCHLADRVMSALLRSEAGRAVPGPASTALPSASMLSPALPSPTLPHARPRLAVCALNCHGGEGGLFGREEIDVIAPAVAQARAAGLQAVGPLPADTLIGRAVAGEFDAVVAMYHDQGHIPLKLLGMHDAVNITLGLPIIRTSVAHGTAFDRAWKGTAETRGLTRAIAAAVRLAENRPDWSIGLASGLSE